MTGRLEPTYPAWKRIVFRYLVSVPIIILCLLLVFIVMIFTLQLQVCVSCLLLLYVVRFWALTVVRVLGCGTLYLGRFHFRRTFCHDDMVCSQYWYLIYQTTWHHILEDHFVKLRIMLLEYFLKCSFDRNGGTSELQSGDTSFVSVTCLRSC